MATEPRESCLGLWLALEDATLENGCLWARRGSHKEPIRRRFIRNPAVKDIAAHDSDEPTLIFEQKANPIPWDGAMPEGDTPENGVRKAGFEPLPVYVVPLLTKLLPVNPRHEKSPPKKQKTNRQHLRHCRQAGDLVLIHGAVDHLSLANTSGRSRHTFQLHLVEGPGNGVCWVRQTRLL